MIPQTRAALEKKSRDRLQCARELIAYADLSGIEIGFEGGFTTFTPQSNTPQRFIEEATILSAEIRALKEGRVK